MSSGPSGSAMPDAHSSPVRVTHTTHSLHASHGGPPRTVTALAETLGRDGASVRLVAVRDGTDDDLILPDPDAVRVSLVAPGRGESSRVRAAVAAGAPDLVHDHGLWLPFNHAVARAARETPRVVSTRGMLEPWARRHRWLKKRAAWAVFQRRDLARASVFHATAESEADHLGALGLGRPVAVIPNGVAIPAESAAAVRDPERTRRAVFLSRVHPKKGLPLLLDAWAQVAPAGWELVVAGPDEGGHRAELEAQARRLGVPARFVGPVADADKWDLYRSADLFVLPTYSENFGVVVAEALAAGVPALTTTGTPWAALAEHACGWVVEPAVRPLRDALAAAVALPDAERAAMGARGRALVAARFGWPAIARDMAEVYDWVLGRRSSPPACVRLP